MDVIKTRMQGLQASKYKNSLDCALQIARHEVRACSRVVEGVKAGRRAADAAVR